MGALRRGAGTAALLLLAAAGCAGGSRSTTTTHSDGSTSSARVRGLVSIRHVTYRRPDGSSVTGLVAIPRTDERRGCLIWQGGLGSTKESSAIAWQGAAALGLATFSIDFHLGGRALSAEAQLRAAQDPAAFVALIRDTVADLQGAVAYLRRQPYCRANVAYAGISFGGVVGTMLAATDRGVDAVVLMSTPGTFGPEARKLLDSVEPARFVARIAPRPLLILSGKQDELVPPSSALALQEAARAPKSIVRYDGGHDPLHGAAAAGNANAIASFLLRDVVEPTFGISASAKGTYTQRGTRDPTGG
jgi:dienelactone hydrolase